MRKTRHRRQPAANILPLPPVDLAATTAMSRRAVGRHVHGRGYLAHGKEPRCGCGLDALMADSPPLVALPASDARWMATRGQHVGFVRTHFIYSDRMLRGAFLAGLPFQHAQERSS
jgi:hypothetical protein